MRSPALLLGGGSYDSEAFVRSKAAEQIFFNYEQAGFESSRRRVFYISKGETFGLVGESGCGKSTAGRTIIGLYNRTSGEVLYKGKNVHELSEKEKFAFHRNMQMIFQDPYASLNPRSTVKEIILEPMEVHGLYSIKRNAEPGV